MILLVGIVMMIYDDENIQDHSANTTTATPIHINDKNDNSDNKKNHVDKNLITNEINKYKRNLIIIS